MTRRELILGTARDTALDFVSYNRKHDEELPLGEIQAAIKAREVTVEEIVEAFRKGLEGNLRCGDRG